MSTVDSPTSEPSRVGAARRWLAPQRGRVPLIAAALTGLVALINIASALTPDIHWRGHLLLGVEGIGTMRFFHALALPAGTALLLTAPYLLKRRRRALHVAVAILVLAGFVNMLKGLDFEECIAGWLLAAALISLRADFDVVAAPITLRSAVWRVPLLGALGLVLITLADWITHGTRSTRLDKALDESTALLRGHENGPLKFESHTARIFDHSFQFAWIPLAVHFLEIGTLLSIAYVIFRPLGLPSAPAQQIRRLVADTVRRHGSDTLSFFKLREDNRYYFTEDRSAFVGYKVDSGVLLLSGDPVGPAEKFPELLIGARLFARSHGLRFGALATSARMRELYAGLGMATMYIGEEAIVETAGFSLEGRAIRKVRQSVNRLAKNGYRAELCTLADLDEATVVETARQGRPEIGFTMGMDSIRGANCDDTLFLLARDADNHVRGFLHFVPCYGRAAFSLSLMRRDPSTPNGLMEFLIVHGIEALRERGTEEVSLNFAVGARWIHAPQNRLEWLAGKVVIQLDKKLQLESLYRFNEKFGPRWEPRYIAFEGWRHLPRTGLAGIWLEGQLPKPHLPRMPRRRGARYIGEAAAAELR